jgi:hypothetical protein
MKRHHWKAIGHGPRQAVIDRVQTAIAAHGFLVDFKLFSDASMSLIVESTARQLPLLHAALSVFLRVEEEEPLPPASEQEVVVMLHLSFAEGTGNLTHEVPAV